MTEILRSGVKRALKNVWFYIFACIGIALMIVSFIIPPAGAIDESVLKAVAWVFGFAALSILNYAIALGADAKVTHGETTIEINTPDNPC